MKNQKANDANGLYKGEALNGASPPAADQEKDSKNTPGHRRNRELASELELWGEELCVRAETAYADAGTYADGNLRLWATELWKAIEETNICASNLAEALREVSGGRVPRVPAIPWGSVLNEAPPSSRSSKEHPAEQRSEEKPFSANDEVPDGRPVPVFEAARLNGKTERNGSVENCAAHGCPKCILAVEINLEREARKEKEGESQRAGETVSRQAHNLEKPGSTPGFATDSAGGFLFKKLSIGVEDILHAMKTGEPVTLGAPRPALEAMAEALRAKARLEEEARSDSPNAEHVRGFLADMAELDKSAARLGLVDLVTGKPAEGVPSVREAESRMLSVFMKATGNEDAWLHECGAAWIFLPADLECNACGQYAPEPSFQAKGGAR